MNLISCDNCGVVLDKNKLWFPDDIYNVDGCLDKELGVWSQSKDRCVAYIKCPVCGEKIEEE